MWRWRGNGEDVDGANIPKVRLGACLGYQKPETAVTPLQSAEGDGWSWSFGAVKEKRGEGFVRC